MAAAVPPTPPPGVGCHVSHLCSFFEHRSVDPTRENRDGVHSIVHACVHALGQADPGCDVTRCVTVCTHFTRTLYQVREACHVVLISRLWAMVLNHASNMPTAAPTVPARARKNTIPGQGSTPAASLCPEQIASPLMLLALRGYYSLPHRVWWVGHQTETVTKGV